MRDALERVGLSPVERFLSKLPGDLSGGQKQRAVIARAIILGPDLLVADEPVSMLDMSVRAKILELMLDLKRDLDLTYVYITHDLATAKFFCDRVAIMYLGRVVEIGPTAEIFAAPKHPYTKALLAAIPEPDPERALPRDLPRGEIPDAAQPPHRLLLPPPLPGGVRPLRLGGPRPARRPREPLAQRRRRGLRAGAGRGGHARRRRTVLESRPRLRPGSGHTVADVRGVLDRLRAADRDEPMWRGVHHIDDDGSTVTVHFTQGEDPALRRAEGADVACLLYDE